MRYRNVLGLMAVLVLAVLTVRMTPSYVETILRPSDDTEKFRTIRKMCRDTLARYHALYRDRPIEEWPDEGIKQTCANAERILDEMEETQP
jgi:hypothetical protein